MSLSGARSISYMSDIISIASDHAGYELKSEIKSYLETLGYKVLDRGCTAEQSRIWVARSKW